MKARKSLIIAIILVFGLSVALPLIAAKIKSSTEVQSLQVKEKEIQGKKKYLLVGEIKFYADLDQIKKFIEEQANYYMKVLNDKGIDKNEAVGILKEVLSEGDYKKGESILKELWKATYKKPSKEYPAEIVSIAKKWRLYSEKLYNIKKYNIEGITVAGNNFEKYWDQYAYPLTDPDKDGIYEGVAPIKSPVNPKMEVFKLQYKFVLLHGMHEGTEVLTWIEDPNNPNKTDDGFDGYNSVLEINIKKLMESVK